MVPEVPSKVTVLVPAVNVGEPEIVQLPETVNVPEGAVSVPEESVSAPLTSTTPEEPVNVPPEIVSPPLNVCVAVLALYSPALTVTSPATVTARALASNAPLPEFVNVPSAVSELVTSCRVAVPVCEIL